MQIVAGNQTLTEQVITNIKFSTLVLKNLNNPSLDYGEGHFDIIDHTKFRQINETLFLRDDNGQLFVIRCQQLQGDRYLFTGQRQVRLGEALLRRSST